MSLPYRPCVGLMLVNDAGKVWTGRRRDRPKGQPAAWQMPQGGVDPGEDVREAGLRELWEETGLGPDKVELRAQTEEPITYDLPPELQGNIWGGRYRGQSMHWLLLHFTGADGDIDIETRHPEFDDWKWQDPNRLVSEIVPFKREVYARVVDHFRSFLR